MALCALHVISTPHRPAGLSRVASEKDRARSITYYK
jgi:hypothetical protein